MAPTSSDWSSRPERIDLGVVGPEAPLVFAAHWRKPGSHVLSATAGAQLEARAFCKQVMESAAVPTAAWVVTTIEDGLAAITGFARPRTGPPPLSGYPAVIKPTASRPAGAWSSWPRRRWATGRSLLVDRRFGTDRVVVEEFLFSPEVSLLAICDGVRALPWRPPRTTSVCSTATEANTGGRCRLLPGAGDRRR